MGRIFAHVTGTRVNWECDEQDCDHFGCTDYPNEEHGWVDVRWSARTFYESRNDVHPFVNEEDDSEELQDEILAALGWLEGGYEDNGDGTFYSADSYQPFDEPWDYSYALHFTHKFVGPKGWTEEPWHPKRDGGFEI